MATRYRTRTRAPVEVGFSCSACGYAARAVIEGEGIGTATSYIVLDRKSAREAAAEEAVAEARHDAQLVGSILPCPQCQRRSRVAVASFVARGVLAVTGFLALGVALWWLMDVWLRWVLLAAMVGAAVSSARRRRSRYQLASALVIDIRPETVLPRAHARRLSPAVVMVTAPAASVEPTLRIDEPHTLR